LAVDKDKEWEWGRRQVPTVLLRAGVSPCLGLDLMRRCSPILERVMHRLDGVSADKRK